MPDTILRVENLGKKYILRHQQGERYTALRDVLVGSVRSFGRKLRPGNRQAANLRREEFWALKDVSFEIKRGDVVGIIGRNGAGKSTLLKILSRITPPTTGRIEGKGRVASLLEVGTGFHPELTGRENIYLNGAILGMSRTDIRRKFDEIVDFAEVEKFLDTPVKRYSSGMYVRLAFAVAAHLEPEILVVDEVLAVGDAAFQKKCLGKMSEVSSKEGRTVLFVSHNMSAIANLCNTGLHLNKGELRNSGNIKDIISDYLSNNMHLNSVYKNENTAESGKLQFREVRLLKEGIEANSFYNSEVLEIEIKVKVNEKISGAQIAFELFTELNECLFTSSNQDVDGIKEVVYPGQYIYTCKINLEMFRPGRYILQFSSSVPGIEILEIVQETLSIEIYDDISPVLKLGQGRRGIILPILKWNSKFMAEMQNR